MMSQAGSRDGVEQATATRPKVKTRRKLENKLLRLRSALPIPAAPTYRTSTRTSNELPHRPRAAPKWGGLGLGGLGWV